MIETADGWHLARDHRATASVGNGEGESALRARVEAEIPELRGPVRVGITQALDVDAARQAAFDGCLDEFWSKKRE